jgi:DNA repair protein RecN (Recombination protein N)
MINFLRVRNLATIEDLELRLEPGFSILTGETGAGKSVIIDAIRLILGEKASPDLIRTGTKEAFIEAGFDVKESAVDLDGLPPAEDGELFLQRQIPGQGTGKSYINGVLAPVRRLRDLSPQLIDIYGQNDHVFLLHLDNHLRYLDAFLDEPALVAEVARSAQEVRKLMRERRNLEAREKEREQRLDFLDFQIREIEAAGLKPGEDEELLRERAILKNAEKIAGLVDRALDVAYLREESLLPLVSRLQSLLGELTEYDETFREFRQGFQDLSILVKDVADALVRFKDRRAEAPEDPEVLEERLSIIEKAKRKYGPTIADALGRLDELKKERTSLTTSRERLQDMEAEIGQAFDRYAAQAGRLGALRTKAAATLERLIEKEIAQLGMKKARFKIRIEAVPPKSGAEDSIRDQGSEDVEFLISPNPGEELRPLRRIASGGELSRIMLSLKSVGKESETRKTLIFDEIDAGIGGKTAECIAQKLRALAARHQVICITHLPQIASSASHHYRVEKRVEKDRTYTQAAALDREERVTEIARLISGSRLTSASVETAREMLDRYPEGKKKAP